MPSTFTRNSRHGSAKATTTGHGSVEVELILNQGEPPMVMGGITADTRGANSLRYRDQPCGGAQRGAVAESAMVSGF